MDESSREVNCGERGDDGASHRRQENSYVCLPCSLHSSTENRYHGWSDPSDVAGLEGQCATLTVCTGQRPEIEEEVKE